MESYRSHHLGRFSLERIFLIGAIIVLVTIAVAPAWFFGSVEPSARVWLFRSGAFALFCCWVHLVMGGARRFQPPAAMFMLVGAIGLGAFQLVGWNQGLLEKLSPANAGLWRDFSMNESENGPRHSVEGDSIEPKSEKPISLNAASTRADLAQLVLATGLFFCAACALRRQNVFCWLFLLIAVNGAVLSLVGVAEQLRPGSMALIVGEPAEKGAPFTTFVNRNNAGGYLTICLAAAIGLSVWSISRRRSVEFPLGEDLGQPRFSFSFAVQLIRTIINAIVGSVGRFLRDLDSWVLISIICVGLIGAGVVCSLSRGAWAAAVGAAILTTALVKMKRGSRRKWEWIAIGVVCVVLLIGWTGRTAAVSQRLETLIHPQTNAGVVGRLDHWRIGLRSAAMFWRLGSGLGAYRYVYPLQQDQPESVWFYHAENQYLEALVDGGFVGLGLMVGMVIMVGAACWQLLGAAQGVDFAIGVGGLFALISQAIHALSDFGLYIPANMALFAILCGAVCGRAARRISPRAARVNPRGSPNPRRGRLAPRRRSATALSASLCTALFAAVLWGSAETKSIHAIESAVNDCRPLASQPATPEDIRAAAVRLETALQSRPDDVEGQQWAARLWSNYYRAQRVRFQKQNDPENRSSDAALWRAANPIRFHDFAHKFRRASNPSGLEKIRNDPAVAVGLTEALRRQEAARRACPVLPKVHLQLALLCGARSDPEQDQIHLHRARRLAPANPDILVRCGYLEYQAGRIELAWACWRMTVAHSEDYLSPILQWAEMKQADPQQVVGMLPDSPELIVQVIRRRFASSTLQDKWRKSVRRLLVEKGRRVIERNKMDDDMRSYLLATVLNLQGEYAKAIPQYKMALSGRPGATQWRYEFAQMLHRQDRIDEALEQAKICKQIDSENPNYDHLLRQLIRKKLTKRSP